MSPSTPNPGPRHAPERVHEHASDPAEAVNRPLEPKAPAAPLKQRDEPDPEIDGVGRDPHSRLNTPVGTPDPAADSDPYTPPDPQNEADTASGTRGLNQGVER